MKADIICANGSFLPSALREWRAALGIIRTMLSFNIVARKAMLLALPCLFVRALYADR